jgi:hypothetical protein
VFLDKPLSAGDITTNPDLLIPSYPSWHATDPSRIVSDACFTQVRPLRSLLRPES